MILTEAATGNYALTPVIAAMAGADRVYTLTRDSRFGSAKQALSEVCAAARAFGVEDRITPLARDDERIADADVITNLGFVRPIDEPFIARLKKTAAVPLMWETWEYRESDLDLRACRAHGIPVLGTDEHHPRLRTFDYLGAVAAKLLLDLGVEITQSSVVVLGSGEFGYIVERALSTLGAKVRRVKPNEVLEAVRDADALVVVEHESREALVGAGALAQANPTLAIAHICGGVERSATLRCAPAVFAAPGSMSVTTDYVGPKPLIDLHAAGLRVGELLTRARQRGLDARAAELAVLEACPFAQDFPEARY